jgi:putative addiction module killer protein
MAIEVRQYVRADGSNPFEKWFGGLHDQAAAKVSTALQRIEAGNTSNIRWIGTVGEYRIDWGPGYRVYLAKDGDRLIILLGGGTKKGQQSDIDRAKALWAEYKARKSAAAKSKDRR